MLWTTLVGPDLHKVHQLKRSPDDVRYRIFDLERDELESRALEGEAERVRRRLVEQLLSERRENLELRQRLDLAVSRALDPELLETLSGLGYAR